MKYIIPLVAVIAVAIVGTISITGFSAATMMTGGTQMVSSSSMMGHIEYTLYDSEGNIKAYGQTDNLVTNNGDKCAAELIFGDTDNGGIEACSGSAFSVIAISNKTLTVADATDLSADDGTPAANSAGIMAAIDVGTAGVTIDAIGAGAGSIGAVISNTLHPFTFEADTTQTNMTSGTTSNTLKNAYLLDAPCATVDDVDDGQGTCLSNPAGEILAGQSLNNLSVSDGDSLTITWTVDLGAAE